MSRLTLSVSQLNEYVRRTFQMDPLLQDIEIQGEISNLKWHQTGTLFFTLKDEQATVACVMYALEAAQLQAEPFDGMRAVVLGNVGLYVKGGQYQFYAKSLRAQGLGVLYEQYEKLKAKLHREGLFDVERKKPLPGFVNTIGVVTSPTGAVLHDIIRVATRRDPQARILLCPARVQGAEAADEIIRAMNLLEKMEEIDVIVLARGGGSLEDLWSFNEEKLVRTVAQCSKPVVSAIGHETDFTLCDFAADLRAPTPSAAAELVTPQREAWLAQVAQLKSTLDEAVAVRLNREAWQLTALKGRLSTMHPKWILEKNASSVTRLKEQMQREAALRLSREQERLERMKASLDLLNPYRVLERGYAIVAHNGSVVSNAAGLVQGDKVTIRFARGTAEARILDVTGSDKPREEEYGT